MFGWRQWRREGNWRGVERDWRGPQARRRPRALLGALLCLALLALPLAAEEIAKAEPDMGLKARGQAFWEARIKEDYALQYGLLEPKVRRQLSLTDYIQVQGPLQYLEARIEGVQIDEAKAVLAACDFVSDAIVEVARTDAQFFQLHSDTDANGQFNGLPREGVVLLDGDGNRFLTYILLVNGNNNSLIRIDSIPCKGLKAGLATEVPRKATAHGCGMTRGIPSPPPSGTRVLSIPTSSSSALKGI